MRVLSARYEDTGTSMMRVVAMRERFPEVDEPLRFVQEAHAEWLAATFAPWLAGRGLRLPEPRRNG